MTATAYDVFISHAFEDKNTFTNALALALKQKGLRVWYSGFELKMGDSITSSVNNALKNVKYAVVVISPIYLEKKWAMNELQALFAGEAEHKRILPILHQISVDEIKMHLPMLADRYAIPSDRGLEVIVSKIMEVVTGKTSQSHAENTKAGWKNTNEDEEDGFIALGRGKEEKKNNSGHNNTNNNTNTNNINVHTYANAPKSNWITRLIVIGLIGVALFLGVYYFNTQTGKKVKPPVIENGSAPIPGERVR
jgi:hypothetical protein